MEHLQNVIAELGLRHEGQPPKSISRTRILELTQDGDVNVLGAVYAFITNPQASQHIDPPLLFEDYYAFLTMYYARCLKEDPQSAWADSRFSAGLDFVNWFASLWHDTTIPRSSLTDLKNWLGGIYREADEALRVSIVQATLEHLFEQNSIREFFSEWKNDPVLQVAYSEAIQWVKGGGNTPLGKSAWFKKAKAADRKH